MKSGFGHFDTSHRENFCAAVLLLTMEVDAPAKDLIADIVREKLGIDAKHALTRFGREARLEKAEDGYARTDLWLRFDSPEGPFFAFVEVKTHNGWDEANVASQVSDQCRRKMATSALRVGGCVLLAPDDLCNRVLAINGEIPVLTWKSLLARLRDLPSLASLTKHAIEHLDEQMEHAPGLDHPLSLEQFEHATTTIACLRQFLAGCVTSIDGHVQGVPLNLTPGDGRPRRAGDWAWHGLSVPFTLKGQKGRVGMYKYAEAPPTDASAVDALWLEVYLDDADAPDVFLEFAPPTLAERHLGAIRDELARRFRSHRELLTHLDGS